MINESEIKELLVETHKDGFEICVDLVKTTRDVLAQKGAESDILNVLDAMIESLEDVKDDIFKSDVEIKEIH